MRSKKRRFVKWAILGMLCLPVAVLMALVTTSVLLPEIVGSERLRKQLVGALTERLGAEVVIEGLKYHTLTGFELSQVRVGPPEGFLLDVFKAERLKLGYDLDELVHGRLVVRELVLDAPEVVLERRGGVTNVEALLARIVPPSSAPEADDPSDPQPFSLPVDVVVERVTLGPLSFIIAGEGPEFHWVGGHVGLEGRFENDVFEGGLRMWTAPEAASAPDEDLLALGSFARFRYRALGQKPSTNQDGLRGRVGFWTEFHVSGDLGHGLRLDEVAGRADIQSRVEGALGGHDLPATRSRFHATLARQAPDDVIAVPALKLIVNEAPVLDASLKLVGASAFVSEVLGLDGAQVLLMGSEKSAAQGLLSVRVKECVAPLSVLGPYARILQPSLSLEGNVRLSEAEWVGTAQALKVGRPQKVGARLEVAGVSVVDRRAKLKLRGVEGMWVLAGPQESPHGGPEVAPAYVLEGNTTLRRVAHAQGEAQGLRLEGRLHTDTLFLDASGSTELALDLSALRLNAEAFRAKAVSVGFKTRGPKLLFRNRGALPPVELSMDVGAARAEVLTGTTWTRAEGLRLALSFLPDRVVESASLPIPVQARLSIQKATLPPQTKMRGLRLTFESEVVDPRRGEPIDVRGQLKASVLGASFAGGALSRTGLTLRAAASGLDLRPGASSAWPRDFSLQLEGSAPEAQVGNEAGHMASSLRLALQLRGRPREGTLRLKRFSFKLGKGVALLVSGHGRRVFGNRPWFDGTATLDLSDLKRIVTKVPEGWRGSLADLEASGRAGLKVRFTGTPRAPHRYDRVEFRGLPFRLAADLQLDGVSAKSAVRQFECQNLRGSVGLRWAEKKSGLQAALQLDRLHHGASSHISRTESVALDVRLGLEDSVWGSDLRLSSQRFQVGSGPVDAAELALSWVYHRGGDFELQKLAVHLPSGGLTLDGAGGLFRRRYGVMRPDFWAKGEADLGQLAQWLPGLEGLVGGFKVGVEASPVSDEVFDLSGSVAFEDLTWARQGLLVRGASGRIPVSQRFSIPPPAASGAEGVLEGVLGDDLEFRLKELWRRLLRYQLHLDTQDILVTAPRTADYDALRPYYRETGAKMTVEGIVYEQHAFEDIIFEGLWDSGVLRIDRLAVHVYEGDFMGDFAVQLTADGDLRARLRATLTDINLDVPYALARGTAFVEGDEKQEFTTTATMDLQFGLRDRALNGRIDLARVSRAMLERIYGALGEEESSTVLAIKRSERIGVRPTSGYVSISYNLLRASFEWERLWPWKYVSIANPFKHPGDAFWDTFMLVGRIVTIPILGAETIRVVNDKFRRISLTSFIERQVERLRLDQTVSALSKNAVSSPEASQLTSRGPKERNHP